MSDQFLDADAVVVLASACRGGDVRVVGVGRDADVNKALLVAGNAQGEPSAYMHLQEVSIGPSQKPPTLTGPGRL